MSELVLEKPISVTFDLIKGATLTQDGRRLFHGAAALVDDEDLDRETMVKAAVNNGLNTFMRMGGHVDWNHLFATSNEAQHIIGKAISKGANPEGGADIVTTQLKRNNKFADQAWEHFHDPDAPGVLGYSLYGKAIARDPLKKSAVTQMDIYMLTITPIAKGFEGPRLSSGEAPSLGQLMKGLTNELCTGDLCGWKEREPSGSDGRTFYSIPASYAEDPIGEGWVNLSKALTTGGGIASPNAPASAPASGGGSAAPLRKQFLLGGKNDPDKKKKPLASIGADGDEGDESDGPTPLAEALGESGEVKDGEAVLSPPKTAAPPSGSAPSPGTPSPKQVAPKQDVPPKLKPPEPDLAGGGEDAEKPPTKANPFGKKAAMAKAIAKGLTGLGITASNDLLKTIIDRL